MIDKISGMKASTGSMQRSTMNPPRLSYPLPSAWMSVRVVALCWLAILSEGYDVGVIGAILPSLAADPRWALSPLELGALGSYGLLGMFLGGGLMGTTSDLFGRKPLFLFCVVFFSLAMAGAAMAPTPRWFGIFRFVGGIGLGGIIPIAAAYTTEFSRPEHRGINYGLMYSGYSFGILCAALVAINLSGTYGWRSVVWVGVIPLAFVPIFWVLLPQSLEVVVRHSPVTASAVDAPSETARRRLRTIMAEVFSADNALATVCLWFAISMGLLLVYGLTTWLPQIMRHSGYDLGSSLSFLVAFSLASALGGAVAGLWSDKRGMKPIIVAGFLLGAIGIAGLSLKGSLVTNIMLVALAGLGSVSASLILTAFIANYYAPDARASATGLALSVARIGAMAGPIVGGLIARREANIAWNFYIFSAVSLAAAAAVSLVPVKRR